MKKLVKNISLIILMIAVSSAVANWGNELTKDAVVVTIALFASAFIYAFADAIDD